MKFEVSDSAVQQIHTPDSLSQHLGGIPDIICCLLSIRAEAKIASGRTTVTTEKGASKMTHPVKEKVQWYFASIFCSYFTYMFKCMFRHCCNHLVCECSHAHM